MFHNLALPSGGAFFSFPIPSASVKMEAWKSKVLIFLRLYGEPLRVGRLFMRYASVRGAM
jgi:hypothetical protein